MTRRQKFKELRIKGYTLKTTTNFINNSLNATKGEIRNLRITL